MAKDDFTPEEWATLTEEERKAHEEDDEEDGTALNDGDKGQVGDDEPKKPEEAKGDEGDTEEEQPQEQSQEDKEQKPAPPVPPHFAPVLPVNAELVEIQEKLKAIDEAFNQGDLDQIEYQNQREPLLQQKFEISMAQRINEETAKQLWKYEQGLFFKDNPEYRENEFLNAALQRAFHKIDTAENAGKTGLELLNEAKKMVAEQIAAITGQKAQGQHGQDPGDQAKPKKALEGTNLPKTLGGLPASGANETSKDEFSFLDGLEGVELEMAVAKLTPEQERRYLMAR
ncbi:MAG: hypothetical protein HGA63_10355 [Syntrophobacteraceae bacterium]|nr:hypothetical protein [Syntrophobacteraceae bacterium]